MQSLKCTYTERPPAHRGGLVGTVLLLLFCSSSGALAQDRPIGSDADAVAELVAAWGVCPSPCRFDLTGDGMVDEADLAALLAAQQFAAMPDAQKKKDPYAPYAGPPEGSRIIEGDILVPIDAPPGAWATSFWPNGIVPFEFDTNVTAANQNLMLAAMQEWENVANVQFVERNGQSDYIHIQNSTGNSSFVGKRGGRQDVNIFNWGWRFIMAHELGHALGFWHEQSRSDRDTYVTINENRIEAGREHNFNTHDEADVYPRNIYDFDSVMHYGQCAFSTCTNCNSNPGDCRTITVNPPWDTAWQNAIGQRNRLSQFDAMTMSFLYPEPDWRFVDEAYFGIVQAGHFLFPFRQFSTGTSAVPSGGTLIIQPGRYHGAVGVYTKAMTLLAPLGGVVVGE